jgi:hypothetical protein
MNLYRFFSLSALFILFTAAQLFSQTKKYAFVVLTVEVAFSDLNTSMQDREIEKIFHSTPGSYRPEHYKTYYITSSIQSFSLFNEDTKYKFIDDYQKAYKNYPGNSTSKIKKRQCYVFSSYSAASKAREKYFIE